MKSKDSVLAQSKQYTYNISTCLCNAYRKSALREKELYFVDTVSYKILSVEKLRENE